MKEAMGTSFVMGLVITFITIFMLFFAASISYTKAFKVKNKIVEIIEKYDDILKEEPSVCEDDGECYIKSDVETEINEVLGQMGYRVSTTPADCSISDRFVNAFEVKTTSTANYEYCIYGHNTAKGTYYGVRTYIYFEVPIIATKLKFPVYGETKISGILE